MGWYLNFSEKQQQPFLRQNEYPERIEYVAYERQDLINYRKAKRTIFHSFLTAQFMLLHIYTKFIISINLVHKKCNICYMKDNSEGSNQKANLIRNFRLSQIERWRNTC